MADHHDAALIVSLSQWGTALGIEDSIAAIFDDDFDPEQAEATDAAVRRVLQFGETVGTLCRHGVLDSAIVHDWIWVEGLWARVGPAARAARERFGEARLFENFEALASGAS
jgi:hypothetical protein